MRHMRVIRSVLAGALLATSLFVGTPVRAQGCAMCYTAASQQKEQAKQALNYGIVALLAPTLLMFGGVFWLANRSRKNESGPLDEEAGHENL